jgi:hypothetical protein
MRNVAGRSRIRAFAEAVAGLIVPQLLAFLSELSGESAYYRCVDGRRRRRFPEGSIITRREYERWRTEPKSRIQRYDVECFTVYHY